MCAGNAVVLSRQKPLLHMMQGWCEQIGNNRMPAGNAAMFSCKPPLAVCDARVEQVSEKSRPPGPSCSYNLGSASDIKMYWNTCSGNETLHAACSAAARLTCKCKSGRQGRNK